MDSPAQTVRPLAPARQPKPASGSPLPWLKPGIFIGALAPLVSVVVRGSQGALSANPIAEAENELGLAALVLLLASLACTPARRLWGWTWPTRVRRELGLFALFYASLHFLTYLFLDQAVDLGAIIADIAKRPFITVGFLALLMLLPLGFTSTTASIRRLGFRRWQRLHQLAYVAGVLAVVHFLWRVKIDVSQPLVYGTLLAALLGVRVFVWLRQRAASRARPTPPAPLPQ